MECSEVRLKLNDYIKDRLDTAEGRRVMLHVRECPDCLEEMNILREIDEFLGVDTPVFAGADFTHNIMSAIKKEGTKVKAAGSLKLRRLPIINLGTSLVMAGLLTIFINTPMVNKNLTSYTGFIVEGAASINTSISTTTSQVENYLSNISNILNIQGGN